jgi:hypothetical protein
MLKLVRRNKDPKKRKLVFYDGYDHKKIISYVEPCWGWFAVYTTVPRTTINKETWDEIIQRTMENLYWLLGNNCDKKTWVESVTRWNEGKGIPGKNDNKSMFHNIYELGTAIDSFYDGYYKED